MSEKWWDMSDDELDDLFREASDKVDVPFDSSAFNKLRQKIDSQPEAPKGFKKRWLLLLVGLFMLVGVGLVYRFTSPKEDGLVNKNEAVIDKNLENLARKNNASSSDNQKITKESVIEKTDKISTLPSQKTQGITEESISRHTQDLEQKPNDLTEQKVNKSEVIGTHSQVKTGEQKVAVKGKSNQSYLETQATTGEPKLSVKGKVKQSAIEVTSTDNQINTGDKPIITEKEIAISENSVTKNESVNSSERVKLFSESPDNQTAESFSIQKNNLEKGNWKSKNKKQVNSSNSKTSGLFQSIEGQNIYVPKAEESLIQKENITEETIAKTNFFGVDYLANKATKSLFINVPPTEIQPFVDSLPRKAISPKFSRFGVRLAIAPDFSSIENMSTLSLGGSIGLLFEYRISKKLTFQTGLIYSSKAYNGEYDYYHNWTFPSKSHPTKPDDVQGKCKIVDLPINLRINVFQKPQQTWFVGLGVSSYWVLNDDYTFYYDPTTPTTPRQVSWADGTKFYWSALNFSVGWEKQISKHLSFQVEPYLKTPLKSVGRGGVNLFSSGLLFSTKYEF
jgi:Outer membrane protein beta-barrel domain